MKYPNKILKKEQVVLKSLIENFLPEGYEHRKRVINLKLSILEEKTCENCKYVVLSIIKEPCLSCWNNNQYKLKN
jgi:hypothetical protein